MRVGVHVYIHAFRVYFFYFCVNRIDIFMLCVCVCVCVSVYVCACVYVGAVPNLENARG